MTCFLVFKRWHGPRNDTPLCCFFFCFSMIRCTITRRICFTLSSTWHYKRCFSSSQWHKLAFNQNQTWVSMETTPICETLCTFIARDSDTVRHRIPFILVVYYPYASLFARLPGQLTSLFLASKMHKCYSGSGISTESRQILSSQWTLLQSINCCAFSIARYFNTASHTGRFEGTCIPLD